MTPDLTDTETRILLALVDVHARNGRATVRSVADAAGYCSPQYPHRVLHRLRHRGLVDFDNHRSGTLRPLVRLVPLRPDREGER